MSALRRGDDAALAWMYEEYHGLVSRTVRRVMGPDTEDDDLTQEVFYHAIRGVGAFRGGREELGAWLRAIAVARCRKRIRYRRVRGWLDWRAPDQLPEVRAAESTDGRAQLASAWRIIEGMRTEERIAFTLRFIEQLSVPEIVAATGASRSTVKRRLVAARAHFDEAARRDVLLSQRMTEA